MERTFNDWITVTKLRFLSITRYILGIESKSVFPPKDYKLVFEEDFKKLDPEIWGVGLPWGVVSENWLMYYDNTPDCVVANDMLHLYTKYKPKEFDSRVTIPFGVGAIFSKQLWQYGWFEIEAQLPEGKNLWPAIWLTGAWPPEIDIMEAYSENGSGMKSKYMGLEDWKIQPNLHFGEPDSMMRFGADNHPIQEATNKIVKYTLHWTKDFIKIYYDGHLILKTTSPKLLEWYNKENDPMSLLLNNGVMDRCADDSTFKVKSVKIFQKL